MTASQDRTAPDVDLAASRADEAAVAFTEDVRLLRDSLVESVVYALAELDCDTAAGDTYDPDHYREQATAATNAVLTHLAWSTAADPHAEVRHVRAQAWRTVDEAERIAAERNRLAAVVARVEAFAEKWIALGVTCVYESSVELGELVLAAVRCSDEVHSHPDGTIHAPNDAAAGRWLGEVTE